MAAKQQVTQNQTSVSIFRDTFYQKVVRNANIERKEYKVLMLLLTELDGFADWERLMSSRPYSDRRNFRKLSKSSIANTLQMSKTEVKDAIDGLIDKGLVEKGSSSTCKNGYRLKF